MWGEDLVQKLRDLPAGVTERTIRAWCMYDWANSPFATTLMSALFPPFFRSLVIEAGLPVSDATAFWGYTASAALLIAAFIAPVLGAVSDYTGGKKRFVGIFAGFGILATAAFVFIGDDTWSFASLLYIVAAVGFSGSIVFYESILPHITTKKSIDAVSSRGYATGYLGGGTLLTINVLWVMRPEWFGMPDVGFAIRASFLSVAVWWAVYSIPFFARVPEPPANGRRQPGRRRAVLLEGFSRLARTFREVRKFRQLFIYLVAFWVYSDGIGTIIRMATAYGDEIGIGITDMTLALVLTQFVAVPSTILLGRYASQFGAKRSILLTLFVYMAVSTSAYFMRDAWHFYVLALAVGTVQGGAGALSRSLYGSMVPKNRSAEFFGFYSLSAKFAGIFGPLVFGFVSQLVGHSRFSIVSVVIFFIVGAVLLSRVDVEEGKRVARQAERDEESGELAAISPRIPA
jgi:UMF1 family MFS transporter